MSRACFLLRQVPPDTSIYTFCDAYIRYTNPSVNAFTVTGVTLNLQFDDSTGMIIESYTGGYINVPANRKIITSKIELANPLNKLNLQERYIMLEMTPPSIVNPLVQERR